MHSFTNALMLAEVAGTGSQIGICILDVLTYMMGVCTSICVCVCSVSIYIYTHTYTHTSIYVDICLFVCRYVCLCVCTLTCMVIAVCAAVPYALTPWDDPRQGVSGRKPRAHGAWRAVWVFWGLGPRVHVWRIWS